MSGPERVWREALADGRLMLPREMMSGRCFFPPRVASPANGGAWEWVEASGRGTVYSTSVVHPKPPEVAFNVALVELEEGPRLMSRIDGVRPEDVAIGMKVVARIDRDGAEPLLLFVPDGH